MTNFSRCTNRDVATLSLSNVNETLVSPETAYKVACLHRVMLLVVQVLIYTVLRNSRSMMNMSHNRRFT